jgi:hypothetical protein
MRWKTILAAALLALASCSAQTLQYEAIVPEKISTDAPCDFQQGRLEEFKHTETLPLTGYVIACPLTAIFYGGWCWAYLGLPTVADVEEVRELARKKLRVLKRLPANFNLDACVQNERVKRVAW